MAEPVDLLIDEAWLVATMDEARRELAGGWVAIDDGYVPKSVNTRENVYEEEKVAIPMPVCLPDRTGVRRSGDGRDFDGPAPPDAR